MKRLSSASVRTGRTWPVVAGVVVLAAVVVLVIRMTRPGQPDAGVGDALPESMQQVSGKQLFTLHCAPCHGEAGDGNGPAARFLYPRPRNFGEAKFRLVSTTNGRPSDEDLLRVVTRGMPGSAMVPFGHLSEAERRDIVAHVRLLARTNFIEQIRRTAAARGDELTAEEAVESADQVLTPGAPLAVPADLPAASSESVARGREMYVKACLGCHGDQGKGDGTQDQRNDDGMPTRPRDLTRGIFKGGRERDQLYARIMLGLPGSPMPSSANVFKPAEAGDLINYLLSLSDPATQDTVEHRRRQIVAKRVGQTLSGEIGAAVWQAAETVPIVISPIWWRDHDDPDLKVSAVHDGQTLAVRLSWHDPSRNDSVARPEDFEDMAAIQLFKGNPEPFLGMGAEAAKIDLWQWRAAWRRPVASADSQLDDYPFDTAVYGELLKGKDKAGPDFLTARAAGNPLTNPDRTHGASSLAAQGFGSTTFRPRESQKVSADATWKDSRWTVVLRRPLAVAADDGTSLAAGERCSIAFAVWDGAARDRNGQKLISIWHDLRIAD